MNRYEHGGEIPAQRDFSVNINPLGMPFCAKKAVELSLDACEKYPDNKCSALLKKLSEKEDICSEDIIFGNGAADLIYRAVFAAKPRKALLAAPTFSEYERALEAAGCSIDFYVTTEETDFAVNEDITDMITEDTDIFFLCTPNNPTGNCIATSLIEKIADKCRETGTRFVLDLCFYGFTGREPLYKNPHLSNCGGVMINAFTKLYAMAGLRLGFAVCPDREFIRKMKMCGADWSVSVPAQAAGAAALDDEEYISKSLVYISREREYLKDALEKKGIKVFPSETNFLLVKTDMPIDKMLSEHDIAVRSCENFRGLDLNFYRIAVKRHEDNAALIYALGKEAEKWQKA